eukprot:scaffold169882_cov32-Prasinocladus_malaysianus.AAC.2
MVDVHEVPFEVWQRGQYFNKLLHQLLSSSGKQLHPPRELVVAMMSSVMLYTSCCACHDLTTLYDLKRENVANSISITAATTAGK